MRQGGRLEKKYNSTIKTLKAVIEELKQRVATIATNVNRSYWKTDRRLDYCRIIMDKILYRTELGRRKK